MARYQILLLFIIPLADDAFAQVYPVQGSATLVPPYALRLSDYSTSTSERIVFNALLADVTKAELHVRFKVSIVGQNVKLETKPEYIGSPITLQGGVPLRLTNVELAEYFDVNHLNFSGLSKNDFFKTGNLPEGFYQFCFEVYEYGRGVKISNAICAPAWLILNDPPIVNLPRIGEKLKPLSPQNVILQWTPRHTGSPNAAFTTEYDIKVVEVWPSNRNPNDAILSQPSIYEATTHSTTFIYGPDATQLEPGRTYAFRVQARAIAGAEHIDLFKNNGFSETVTFVYGDACDAPINLLADAAATRVTLTWDASPSQTAYTVRYRVKGQDDNHFYTAKSLFTNAQLNDLVPNTVYEYQVMSICGSFESNYGDIARITTPDIPQKAYSCGAPIENINLSSKQVIQKLDVGDIIRTGDFDVTATKVSGTNGVFSGEGTVSFPFFNDAKARVKFDGITVGKDEINEKRLLKGEMTVIGPALVPQNVLNAMDELSQTMNAANSVLNTARQFLTPKPDADDFVADQVINVPSGIGNAYYDVATGKVIVVDNNGKQQSLPADRNYALTDGTGGGVIIAKDGGITKVTAPEMGKVLDRKYDPGLVFANTADSQYGIDIQKVDALKKNYEEPVADYFVPFKAVAVGSTETVSATPTKTGMDLSKIKFDQDNGSVEATVIGDRINFTATAKTTGDSPPVFARMIDAAKKETIVGKLNVAGYTPENLKLHLVPVNGTALPTTAADIEKHLNLIYSQAVVTWTVTLDANLKVDGLANPFDNGSSGILSTYTDDMRTVINAYLTNTKLENDNYYLFLIPKGTNTNENGYMPRSKQCGFIFDPERSEGPPTTNAQPPTSSVQFIRTIAHELGHGAFTLEHTFAEYPALAQGTTDNLMDYSAGTTLWKYQWDIIHNNRIVLGVFESDEAGASVSSPTGLIALINADTLKTNKIFIVTGTSLKLFAKRNVTKGEEVSFRLAIKPEGGGADILYPSDDWKKMKNDETWAEDLRSFHEGKYTLSLKVGMNTTGVDFYVRKQAYEYSCVVCGRNLTLSQPDLTKIFPNSDLIDDDANTLNYFNESLRKGGFSTCYRQAHYFSQVYEESGGMKAKIEGSNYPVKRMLEVYRGNGNVKTIFFKQSFWDQKDYLNYASIDLYETSNDTLKTRYEGKAHQTLKWNNSTISDTIRMPTSFAQKKKAEYEKVALAKAKQIENGKNLFNTVYANINGNGNILSGDGYKFRGRGAIQLTGRGNYRAVASKCNSIFGTTFDWENNPETLANDNKSIIYSVTGFFLWRFGDLKNLDTRNVNYVTQKVNGGTTGLDSRTAKFNEFINGRLNNCKIK